MGLENLLNNPSRPVRLAVVRELGESLKSGYPVSDEVNNHVHSKYSFSPYYPTMIAVNAARAGLKAVGIMDHDSISGFKEMIAAGKAINIATTCGFEMRVNMTGTAFEGYKTNNPDTENNTYMAVHGVPHTQFVRVESYLRSIKKARYLRDREEVDNLNKILASVGLEPLDFDRDVWKISEAKRGGSITERHIVYALSLKLVERFGKGQGLIDFIEQKMKIAIPEKLQEYLRDPSNPHYEYDLLGVFKGSLVPEIFVQPNVQGARSVYDAVQFANDIGGIPAYAYLGDVAESPTGDKKAEKFEDEYLDDLVPELKKIGFKAITYMPPRNTKAQLLRLQKLCDQYDLMQISGVDINSSRQVFNCPEIMQPEFQHLIGATWALIAHEKLASAEARYGLFHPDNPLAAKPLKERIEVYADIGMRIDNRNPESAIDLVNF
ncbi:PHP domain-containing protein [Pontiella sp.]|uniref:PHP domain-containing protein n=1 Tax=Pontiella sp. TaxID=2837462 RepID=UPI00356661EB